MSKIDNFNNIDEIRQGLISPERLSQLLDSGKASILRGRQKTVAIGNELPAKVSVLLGMGKDSSMEDEARKVAHLDSLAYRPDMIMDLSIVRPAKPFYTMAVEYFSGPVGTLPHYLAFSPGSGLPEKMLLDEMENQAKAGVAWFTIHPTPTISLWEKAQLGRQIPMSSRGGGIIIYDMIKNARDESIYAELFDKVLAIASTYHMALSIGSVFRPACTEDALDEVHLLETERQWVFVNRCIEEGVPVILEGIGHIDLEQCKQYVSLIKKYGDVPFMPLGPIPTDAAIGLDHISAAIGGAWLAMLNCVAVLNAVTRIEHVGGIPDILLTEEALQATRIAAHSANMAKFGTRHTDKHLATLRGQNTTCVVKAGLFDTRITEDITSGCNRCGSLCPLIMNERLYAGKTHLN